MPMWMVCSASYIRGRVFLKRMNNLMFHLDHHGHTAAVYAFHCTNLRQLTSEFFRRTVAPKEFPP
jgi:hypothetical protein